ncbi:MAG: YsnF/AvaK domain-containing protein [Nakamurella sp.]
MTSPAPLDAVAARPEPTTTAAKFSSEVAVTRSEERLTVHTVRLPVARVRFRKRIVTETRTVTIEVSREELIEERETIEGSADQPSEQDASLPARELEIVLHEQRPVITMKTVAVERVLVRTRSVTEDQRITEPLGKEQVELHRDEPASVQALHVDG